jgi:nitroreductase
MSLMMKRSSIRKYTNQMVEKEKVIQLLKAGMQAPSAKNQQPWEFIVVDDKSILKTLSNASVGAWMLNDAQLAIIPMIMKSEKAPHFSVQDLSAATENILLEATNQGLGAVWIGVYPLQERVDFVEATLGIKGEDHPFAMIAIGYPEKQNEIKERYDESRVHYNTWSK